MRTSSGVGETTYVLTFEHNGETVHLALQDPARDRSDTAVAFSVMRSGNGEVSLRWMTPGGRLLATSAHSNDGVTTRARDGSAFRFREDGRLAAGASARVGPSDFAVCFALCLGSTVSCAEDCLPCALTRSPIACIKCAACAGPKAISCAKRCV